MDIFEKSKEIERLYKLGRYREVVMAIPPLSELNLKNGGAQICKYYALAVFSTMYGTDDAFDIATKGWNLACSFYEDEEELRAFQIDFIEQLSEVFIRQGKLFLENYNFAASHKEIIALRSNETTWLKFFLFAKTYTDEEDGEAIEEAKVKFFDNRYWEMVYTHAIAEWSQRYNCFVNNSFCGNNKEFALNLWDETSTVILNVKALIEWSTQFDEENNKFNDGADVETCIDRCKRLVEFIAETIDLSVRVNGGIFYLFSSDYNLRSSALSEFDQYVDIIKQYDACYVAPDRPSQIRMNIKPTQTSSGGCYVATAVYGSYDCPQVWTLRRYRDYTLAETWYGRAFIRTYYAISPTLVKWFGETKWFKKLWRGTLDCMVSKLQERGVESTAYEDKPW